MANLSIKKWVQFFSSVAIAVLLNGMTFRSVNAQENRPITDHQACQVTRFRPEISGADNEWIRIERCGNTVQILHTRRGNENRGVLGAINAITDLTGPEVGFNRWHDHLTTRVAFKPDYCTENIVFTNAASCVMTGTETLLLPTEINIYQGVFMIEYIDNELLRTITFRLPIDESY